MRLLVTHGLDETAIETMTEALLTMKSTLTHEIHPLRRYAPGGSRPLSQVDAPVRASTTDAFGL